MATYNKIILAGNLTRDPEMRTLQNGTNVCKFGLATNRKFKTQSGENREEVLFIDIEAWGKQAEIIEQHCNKGSSLLVEGRLRLETWEKDGHKNSRHLVVLEGFQFLGTRKDGSGNGGGQPQSREPENDDLPF